MSLAGDIQSLEPGNKIVLFELDATSLNADQLFFHAHLQSGPIYWQGQQYDPWPIECEGFARSTSAPPQPKLRVGNVDGTITALCLAFDDLVGARLIRRQTLVQYLDSANFPYGSSLLAPNLSLQLPTRPPQTSRLGSLVGLSLMSATGGPL